MTDSIQTEFLADMKGKLLDEQKRLLCLLSNTQSHMHRKEPVSADFAEQAVEVENDEVVAALDQGAQIELSQIIKALQRIEAGDFGNCVVCGKAINKERLKAIPYTPFCIDCASAN